MEGRSIELTPTDSASAGGVVADASRHGEREEKQMDNTTSNKYGVKVGDLFISSWGYEQTNNTFFQVVELVGSSSVRVVEVSPQPVSVDAVSGMAEDITYRNTREPQPRRVKSLWIHDQTKGDLKRLKSYAADKVSNPLFKMSDYASAHLESREQFTLYNSWYY